MGLYVTETDQLDFLKCGTFHWKVILGDYLWLDTEYRSQSTTRWTWKIDLFLLEPPTPPTFPSFPHGRPI